MKQTIEKYNMNDMGYWCKAIIMLAVLTIALGVIPFVYNLLEEEYHDYRHWFTWYSVEPESESFNVGEPILMVSDREVFRPVKMKYNDILNCFYGDNPTFIDNVTGQKYFTEQAPREKKTWEYTGALPVKSAWCYMDSAVAGDMLLSKDKAQINISKQFYINI